MKKILLVSLLVHVSCGQQHVHKRVIPKTELKLCFLGDTGSGSQVQRLVAERLSSEGCDTIHFLGDLIYPSGISSSNDAQLSQKFFDLYQNLPSPLYLVLGNHDHRGSIAAWKELAAKDSRIFFPDYYYLLNLNGLCLVNIDTNLLKLPLRWHLAISQSLWLSNLELSSCKRTIALTHHPYKSRGKHGPATGLVRFMLWAQVLEDYDFLISGHEHLISDEGFYGKTRLLISGGGGAPDAGEKPGFLVITAKFAGEEIKSIEFDLKD